VSIRYVGCMREDIIARLQARMAKLGYNETTLAREAKLGRTIVNDFVKGKSKHVRIDVLVKLCKVLGMSTAEVLDGHTRAPLRVPIIGEITYTDTWRQYISGKKLPEILDLWTPEDDIVAVRVLENSMAPRYQRGDIVLGHRQIAANADNYIGLHCIVMTTDERPFVKVITRGTKPGVYTLRSLDPSTEDVVDVELLWFAPIVSIMPHSV
jgi:DNA-binding Xre family transcriptional regulator